MGIGGIGINAVQGAAHAGAANVIAVDPVAIKREKAQELGATHAVETMEEATELAKQLTNGQGADTAIITVGVVKPEHVGQAMAAIRKAGTVVVTGLGDIPTPTPLPVSLADSRCSRSASRATLFGAANPNWDILRLVELYRSGELKLDELITKTYTLDQIAQGYQDMHDGKNIRASSSSTDRPTARTNGTRGRPIVSGVPFATPEVVELTPVVGLRREREVLTVALATGRHVVLEGPPGTGKSTLLRVDRGATPARRSCSSRATPS